MTADHMPLIDGCETIACEGTPLPNPTEQYVVRGWWPVKNRWGEKKPTGLKRANEEGNYMRSVGWTHVHLIKLPTTYPGGGAKDNDRTTETAE